MPHLHSLRALCTVASFAFAALPGCERAPEGAISTEAIEQLQKLMEPGLRIADEKARALADRILPPLQNSAVLNPAPTNSELVAVVTTLTKKNLTDRLAALRPDAVKTMLHTGSFVAIDLAFVRHAGGVSPEGFALPPDQLHAAIERFVALGREFRERIELIKKTPVEQLRVQAPTRYSHLFQATEAAQVDIAWDKLKEPELRTCAEICELELFIREQPIQYGDAVLSIYLETDGVLRGDCTEIAYLYCALASFSGSNRLIDSLCLMDSFDHLQVVFGVRTVDSGILLLSKNASYRGVSNRVDDNRASGNSPIDQSFQRIAFDALAMKMRPEACLLPISEVVGIIAESATIPRNVAVSPPDYIDVDGYMKAREQQNALLTISPHFQVLLRNHLTSVDLLIFSRRVHGVTRMLLIDEYVNSTQKIMQRSFDALDYATEATAFCKNSPILRIGRVRQDYVKDLLQSFEGDPEVFRAFLLMPLVVTQNEMSNPDRARNFAEDLLKRKAFLDSVRIELDRPENKDLYPNLQALLDPQRSDSPAKWILDEIER
jgi:hypothetical protein